MKLRIGFTYDAKDDYAIKPGDAPDKYAEFDFEETIVEIVNALATSGHEIVRIGHAQSLLDKIAGGERWDLVFNIAEGLKGRNRESQVPMILEMYDIPYAGSDALSMGITLDKAVAKMIIDYHGIRTPRFLEAATLADLDKFKLNFPVFVKPSEEGTSKGISEEAIARDIDALSKRAASLIEEYKQPVLIEEFIYGQEFTVAVIGNESPIALPPVQIAIKGKTDLGDTVYTHAMVANDDVEYICPSSAPKALLEEMMKMTVDAYKALGCRDFSRMDYRVDQNGKPYFLECNPLPHLGESDVFPLVAAASGRTYKQIVAEILNYALKRYNIK